MIKKEVYKAAAALIKKYRYQVLQGTVLVMVLAGACSLSFMAGRRGTGSDKAEAETGTVAVGGTEPSQLPGISPGTPSFAFPPYARYADATASDAEFMQPYVLNLAGLYADGADTGTVEDSYAGQLYSSLASMDAQWFSGIYDLYSYTPERLAAQLGVAAETVTAQAGIIPEFSNISAQFINGDFQTAGSASNIREIISMVNVLHYYGIIKDLGEMKEYAAQLWKTSHNYTVTLGDVYYCDGSCQKEYEAAAQSEILGNGQDAGAIGAVVIASGSTATPSDISEQAAVRICPGHVDCSILAMIRGIKESDGLFRIADPPPSDTGAGVTDSWPGWGEYTTFCVEELAAQDWSEKYGLNITDFPLGHPLSAQEMDLYMSLVPSDSSEMRRGFVRFALSSVGKVPYYWGGKPSAPGYTGNDFGTLASPDEDGRLLKGLDCSGWVNWVYWSATGRGLGAQGTGTLLGSGVPVSREQLLPGDICIRTGAMSHVVIFLDWTDDGQMLCIQETSGNVNNVEVGIKKADWESYRRIVE